MASFQGHAIGLLTAISICTVKIETSWCPIAYIHSRCYCYDDKVFYSPNNSRYPNAGSMVTFIAPSHAHSDISFLFLDFPLLVTNFSSWQYASPFRNKEWYSIFLPLRASFVIDGIIYRRRAI